MSMTYYAVTNDPNELAHFGIRGMRWGIIRTPEQLGHARHTGAIRRRSQAYTKAQSKLSKMSKAMQNGIQNAKAHWEEYNSPKAKEARFMKKAMEKARTGTLKYGKLTDDQVRRITERLALERNARQLGSTENPSYSRRIKTALGEGIVKGIGMGTASYINARMTGRGETTAAIKRDKRMDKYNAKESTQARKRSRKLAEEYYNTIMEEGSAPNHYTEAGRLRYINEVKARNKKKAYDENIQKVYDEQSARSSAVYDTKLIDDDKRYSRNKVQKLEPTNKTYIDPLTGKKTTGNAFQALNAWNTAHENVNKYGNADLDSMNMALAKRQADEARRRQAAARDRAFNEAARNKQREDAARESARVKRETERAARFESINSSRPKVEDYAYARRENDVRNTSKRRKRRGRN